MPIATTSSSVTDQGNGATTLFNYSFLIPAATDVVVTVTDTTVDPTTITTIPASQYVITGLGNSSGGTVQYPLSGSPLASGQYITIARVLAFIQTTQISNQGDFYPQVVENALDYQMMCLQQLSDQVAAASFPDTFVSLLGEAPIVVSVSGGQYTVSLDPITASSISDGAVTTAKLADGAATLAKLDRTGTTGYVLTAQGANVAPIWSALSSTPLAPPVRQTVLAAAVNSSGLASFISIGTGLSVNIAATTVPVYLTAANGFSGTGSVDRLGSISADTTISGLTDSTTNYLYADIASNGTCTLGKTTLAPVYQWGGTYSTTNGQFTFNIQEMVGKVGNGSTAAQTYRVFIGEAVTSGGAVTSVRNYALQGRYRAVAQTVTFSSTLTLNHNIGVRPYRILPYLACISTEAGYAVGDHVAFWVSSSNNASQGMWPYADANSVSLNQSSRIALPDKSAHTYVNLTAAKWNWEIQAERGW